MIAPLALRLLVRHERQDLAQPVKDRAHRLGVDQHQVYVLAVPRLWLEMQLVQSRAATPRKPFCQVRIGIDGDNRPRDQKILFD